MTAYVRTLAENIEAPCIIMDAHEYTIEGVVFTDNYAHCISEDDDHLQFKLTDKVLVAAPGKKIEIAGVQLQKEDLVPVEEAYLEVEEFAINGDKVLVGFTDGTWMTLLANKVITVLR